MPDAATPVSTQPAEPAGARPATVNASTGAPGVEAPATAQPILAAGGILVDGLGRIAVVVRDRYKDVSLPKGKLEPDETLLDAAMREVREETGVVPIPEEFVEAVGYPTPNGPKVVFFWLMRPSQSSGPVDAEEVAGVDWLPPAEAARRLTYEDQRSLVRRRFLKHGSRVAARRRISSWLPWRRSAQSIRLAAHLLSTRPEIEARLLARSRSSDASQGSGHATAVRDLLDRAQRAYDAGELEQSWRCIAAARRCEVQHYEKDPLAIEAATLRHEAQKKLIGWRKDAVADLLLDAGKWRELELVEQRDRLARALLLRDERAADEYHTAALLRQQLGQLTWALVAIVVAILVIARVAPLPLTEDLTSALPVLWYTAAFGALGGCISGAWSLTRNGNKLRIPERMRGWAATAARPALGAGAGVAAFALIGPGLLGVPTAVIAASFVAGFSERYILSVVESKQEKQ